ncbi:MAG TPA: glycosyltransferase family 4 protein [Flavobacterium sp.]|uniref:glycosyltransferase family 4 protein n=1 Tax=Flavobacterium sp. TaxID=239 RepID=UPI002B4B4F30|nr:glycosyltransferase family 4 protein [Flavobacterium sp.]HLO73721.1 glycosyltransferase family 4 protein [Flavobacterium sp.]
MKKIKILYLGNQLYKHGLNKTTIETLGPQLESESFKVLYASTKINFLFRLLDMVLSMFQYRRNIDYILIDTYSTKAFWYAFFCSQTARLFNIKYVPILHGGDLPNRLKKNPKLCQMIFANAYKNVVPSGYLKQAFEQRGYSNLLYIPNSIEIQKYPYKLREKVAPNLLWVRAFATIYNPEMAVKVLFELRKKYPNATLTMVGPDKDGSLLSTKAFADSLGVAVCFTGKLTKEDWWQLAADHDIFINTTHFDNTPVSVMESMALGLPVVSTNVGGIPFLLTDNENALLVDDDDTNQMVAAILKLLENPPQSKKLSIEARRYIEQMDWEIVKKKWNELLE